MFWNAETTLTLSPSKAWACTTADPPCGSCTRETFGGTSGTVTSTSSLPFSSGLTRPSVDSCAACGTVRTTISAARAAEIKSEPVTVASLHCSLIDSAVAAAFAASREPMMTGYPACAQRNASARPSCPVPPRMARMGFAAAVITR